MPHNRRRYSLFVPWFALLLLLGTIAAPAYAEKDAGDTREKAKASDPEEARPAVQPKLEPETKAPPEISLPEAINAGIQQQIATLGTALKERKAAVEASRKRLHYAKSILSRLQDEYDSFELRLEKAGLNLTARYASLLKQRLERLKRQSIASDLIEGIQDKLSSAREEQLRLEEFEAVADPGSDTRGQQLEHRARLLRELHKAVTDHIGVLDNYYNTVTALQDQVIAYQRLLEQRLFWLPSASLVGVDTFGELYDSAAWLFAQLQPGAVGKAISSSFSERSGRILLIALLLTALLIRRRAIKNNLTTNAQYIGNVGHDRTLFSLLALVNSVLLALPGVLVFALAALLLMEGNDFLAALSKGFTAAAFITFLLSFIHNVARRQGLGESHFHWHIPPLLVIRRKMPTLMALVIPFTIIITTINSASEGSQFDDSLGRLLFVIVSVAMAVFAQRIMSAVRASKSNSGFLLFLHILAVSAPLVLVAASLLGYQYTALELERNMFITICWLAFITLLYYLGLRALSVRERRLTLERLQEQRVAEQKLAEAREVSEATNQEIPQVPDMPAMNLKDINQQSSSLLRLVLFVLALTGLFFLWSGIFPALQLFNDITLWTIAADVGGGDPLPITLADLLLAFLIAAGTVLAVKNLPGTLEVMVLSRMNLQPGSGYAITTISTYLLVLTGVVVCLAVIGVQWSKLQWLIAALGVGLGFGLQEIVANFVSGIILLFERPIRVGDTVTIDDITGTVTRIRIRATTLVDWDRKEQIIPNKTFVTQDLTNWTLSDPITRVILRVGVAYGSDVDRVQALLADVAQANERVAEDPAPAVFCVGLGDSSINFEVRVFVRDLVDIMPLSHEIHASMAKALEDAGISIPFPQRDIHVRTLPDPH
jgi:potassium efflux system protein